MTPARRGKSGSTPEPSPVTRSNRPSAEVDFALHDMVQGCALRRDHSLHGQAALALQSCFLHGSFDRLLGCHANLLEELAHRYVEGIGFHVLGHTIASKISDGSCRLLSREQG